MKRMMLCFMLSACAAPPPVLEPVDVDMPVVVACRTAPVEKPDFALLHITGDQNLAEKTKAALIELDQRKSYEAALQSQIALCQ